MTLGFCVYGLSVLVYVGVFVNRAMPASFLCKNICICLCCCVNIYCMWVHVLHDFMAARFTEDCFMG